ncbi:MAG: undecaprenyl/decaprenyl-phosphate alpha-N-acetylglucosaminyl 1-phosphate transferase [Planctomycetes bacterium]|nr:undecaprenyl/decaprenyl-phosphate alpha-N-acetylglucosaminyl 1-phosphate transferase [Planctomycetota bacterium]
MTISNLTCLSLVLPISAFAVSAALTVLVRRIAVRAGFCAYPSQDRYHQRVVALGGGMAIFWTMALFILAGAAVIHWVIADDKFSFFDRSILIYIEGFLNKTDDLLLVMACAAALHLLGLWDDVRRLGPYTKLAVQFAVAVVAAVFADIRVEMFIQNKVITTILSVFWIVGIMNVFNFLDNMDGLSSGMAIIVAGTLLTAAIGSGQVFITGLGLLFLGAVAGFWIWNFPPAKIFMGDCGSLVIGFFVAMLSMRTTYYHQAGSGSLYAVFMPLLALAVPLYDFASVTFLRIKQGKSPFVGDTQHFSHRLRKRGLSDAQVALTLYLATLCTGLGAIFLRQVNLVGAILIFTQTMMVLGIIAILETAGHKNND